MVQKSTTSIEKQKKELNTYTAAHRSVYEDQHRWFARSKQVIHAQEYDLLQRKAREYGVILHGALDTCVIDSIWKMVKTWRDRVDIPRDTRAALYFLIGSAYKMYGANEPALKLALYMINRLFLRQSCSPSYTSLVICPEFGDSDGPVGDVFTSFLAKVGGQFSGPQKAAFNEKVLLFLKSNLKEPKRPRDLQTIDEEVDEVLRELASTSE